MRIRALCVSVGLFSFFFFVLYIGNDYYVLITVGNYTARLQICHRIFGVAAIF